MKKNKNKHKNKDSQGIIIENDAAQKNVRKEEDIRPDVSRAKIALFWFVMALIILLAWALPKFFNTHEYIVERWLMLAFALFLGAFLFTLKDEPKV